MKPTGPVELSRGDTLGRSWCILRWAGRSSRCMCTVEAAGMQHLHGCPWPRQVTWHTGVWTGVVWGAGGPGPGLAWLQVAAAASAGKEGGATGGEATLGHVTEAVPISSGAHPCSSCLATSPPGWESRQDLPVLTQQNLSVSYYKIKLYTWTAS